MVLLLITEKAIQVTLLESQTPLVDILRNQEQRRKHPNKSNVVPIYCYRYIGMADNEQTYLYELKQLEKNLKDSASPYLKITNGLLTKHSAAEIAVATEIWAQFSSWENQRARNYSQLYQIIWDFKIYNTTLQWTLKQSFLKILRLFDENEKNKNTEIRKNFGVSLILWMNTYLPCLFSVKNHNTIPKLIFFGDIRRNEVYFSILLSMLGCDLLYINPHKDKEFSKIDPQYHYTKLLAYEARSQIAEFPRSETQSGKINKSDVVPMGTTSPLKKAPFIAKVNNEVEKSYEELAQLSTSIVMINIYDQHHTICAGGSGVVIDEQGTIVTNYHVIADGCFFGIVFENDEQEYMTETVLAKNEEKDLALLQIDHHTLPIPIKTSDGLKRGQQIVAIGSPLGLMNTISDGIIAGFRHFDDLQLIQITAPISPGSSGGALLDRYGWLVGITTGGYTKGQNLNLAIPSVEIIKLMVIGNFHRPRKR